MDDAGGEGHDGVDPFLYAALQQQPNRRSYEQILTIKNHFMTLDFIKARAGTIRVRQLDDLAAVVRMEQVDPYKFIYKKGDYADKVYVVFSGRNVVMVDSTAKDYERQKLNAASVFRGMLFGEDAVVANKPRPICALNDSLITVELLVIEKANYVQFLRDAYDVNNPNVFETFSGRETRNTPIMKILDKPKQLRTSADVEYVSAFLTKTIPYFQQFKGDQMRELCRIVESVAFWDERILFQQGQRSEAFFAILGGHVDVWCDRGLYDPHKATSADRFGGLYLGTRDTTLVQGITFGERSIETASAIRLSSVVTGEGLTELLVVPREAYLNLIAVLRSSAGMDKVTLLRQTSVFGQLDAAHLSNIASIMHLVTMPIGTAVYKEGWAPHADHDSGLTIIASGECFAETRVVLEIDTSTTGTESAKDVAHSHSLTPFATTTPAHKKKTKKRTLKLGRVGPGSILYHFNVLAKDGGDERIFHTETVTSSTPVEAFVVSKSDFLHLPNDTRQCILREVAADKSATLALDEDTWRKDAAWRDFCKSVRPTGRHKGTSGVVTGQASVESGAGHRARGHASVTESYRALERVHFAPHPQKNSPVLHAGSTLAVVFGNRSNGSRWKDDEFDYDAEYLQASLRGGGRAVSEDALPPKPREWEALTLGDDLAVPDFNPRGSDAAYLGIKHNKVRTASRAHNLAFIQTVPLDPTAPLRTEQHRHHQRSHAHVDPSSPERYRKAPEEPPVLLPFALVHIHIERTSDGGDDDDGNDDDGNDGGDKTNGNHDRRRRTGAAQDTADTGGATVHPSLAGIEKLGTRRRRGMRTHLRLSGAMPTSAQARECAAALVQHAAVNRSDGRIPVAEPALAWQQFVGFEALPLQHSDYFIVYCRSAPVEYASVTPRADFLALDFPAACKSAGRNFLLFTARSIAAPSHVTDVVKEKDGRANVAAATAVSSSSFKAEYATPTTSFSAGLSAALPGGTVPESGVSGTVGFLLRSYADRASWAPKSTTALTHSPVEGGMLSRVPEPDPSPPRREPPKGSQRRKAAGWREKKRRIKSDSDSDEYSEEDEASTESQVPWPYGGSGPMVKSLVNTTVGVARTAVDATARLPPKKLVPPLLQMEFRAFGEALASEPSILECCRAAAAAESSLSEHVSHYGVDSVEQLYLCAAPLYCWHLLCEQTLRELDVRKWLPKDEPRGASVRPLGPGGRATALGGDSNKTDGGGGGGSNSNNSPLNAYAGLSFGPTLPQPSRGRRLKKRPGGNAHGRGLGSIMDVKDGAGADGGGPARDDPLAALRAGIETRRLIIKANDKVCAAEQEDHDRARLEIVLNDERITVAAFTPSPSPEKKPLPTIASSTWSSPVQAVHPAANKPHLKLLEALADHTPIKTVTDESRIKTAPAKDLSSSLKK